MMAKTQILDAVFMTTVHFLKSLKESKLSCACFFFYKESMNFLFSKVIVLIDLITKKELDFGGPRIFTP